MIDKLTADHALDVADLLSQINQLVADVAHVCEQSKKSEGWFRDSPKPATMLVVMVALKSTAYSHFSSVQ